MNSSITYQQESWATYWPDAKPLWEDHWLEIARDRETIPLDPAMDFYAQADAEGILHIMTMRLQGTLIGYHLALIQRHIHYQGTLHAFTDIYYVVPAFRRGMVGVTLFRQVEAALRQRGVIKIMTGTKIANDVSRIFQHLGYRETERLWTKLL
jgi:GNAT superfamily N-acetyltransferase